MTIEGNRIRGELPAGEWEITAAWLMRTGQTVKRSAPGGGGLVLDHFRAQSLDLQLRPLGEALSQAREVAPHALAGVTSDSLELDDSNWTPGFLEEFARRKGYRLEAYLPHLWNNINAKTPGVRQDFLEVLGRLQVENYTGQLTAWCERRGLKSYVQSHGGLADALEAYGAASVPEGETIWPGTERLVVNVRNRRIAASAGDLYGKPVSMAESYTWLRMPRFLVRLDQLKAASDAIVLDGIRHIKNHGFPSSPRELGKPGWVFYASTMINPNQVWWPHYHALSKYVTRLNYLMQAGERVSDVGALLGGRGLARTLRRADGQVAGRRRRLAPSRPRPGPGYDRAHSPASEHSGAVAVQTRLRIRHRRRRCFGESFESGRRQTCWRDALIPRCRAGSAGERTFPVLRKLAAFAKEGGLVISIGRLPGRGTGLDGTQQAAEVAGLVTGMKLVRDEEEAERLLRDAGLQDFVSQRECRHACQHGLRFEGAAESSPLRAIHRRAGDVDYYFVVNGDRENREVEVRFRDARGRKAQLWDPHEQRSGGRGMDRGWR